jgi:glutamine amidotransferase
MCRFVLYLGPEIIVSSLLTDPAHSLIRQSYKSRERTEPLNGDGFGIGWYVPSVSAEPAVFRDISPAWSNQNLLNLARVVRTPCVMAHVRAASVGLPVTQLNCHPFAWRELVFMHNGDVREFARIRRRLCERLSDAAFGWIRGSTDSEHLFALFIDQYMALEVLPPLERLAQALKSTIHILEVVAREANVEPAATLNLAVANGHCAAVSRVSIGDERPNTLYYIGGSSYTCNEGVCLMSRGTQDAVLVASEPLSEDDGWAAVPPNHLVLISETRNVRLEALSAGHDTLETSGELARNPAA